MKQKTILLLALVVLAFAVLGPSGTHAATVTLDRTTGTDIVDQSGGLLAVSQTTTGFNATTNRAELSVEVTNQNTMTVNQVDISADGTTKTTGTMSPGVTAGVSFTDVDCATTIVIEYDTGSLAQRIERPISCR